MSASSWWEEKVSSWLPKGKAVEVAAAQAGPDGGGTGAAKAERVAEVLDAAVVRKVLKPLQAVADSTVSEVEGGRRARAFAQWYAAASAAERRQALHQPRAARDRARGE